MAKLSRRAWAAAAAAVPQALLQPQAPAGRETAAELLEQARQSVTRNRETLAKVKLPMSVEPATRFEA